MNKPAGARQSPAGELIWALEQVRGAGEAEVARFAGLQGEAIHRDQLLAAGIGRGAIAHRLKTGRLLTAYRDVYLVRAQQPTPLNRPATRRSRIPGDSRHLAPASE